MRTFVWLNGEGFIERDTQEARILTKPEFSFAYQSLYYEAEPGNFWRFWAGNRVDLTDAEKIEVLDFINNFGGWPEEEGHGVDEFGTYMGHGPISRFFRLVSEAPPRDGLHYFHDGSEWQLSNGVDEAGNWLGNRIRSEIHTVLHQAPPADHYRWDFDQQRWFDTRPIEIIRSFGLQALDQYAGQMRARFTTLVTGQEQLYIKKLQQAQDYVAAGRPADVSAYPYVALDADLQSIPVSQAADNIIAAAQRYEAKEIEIERVRLSTKASIRAALTADDVNTLLTLAQAQFQQILLVVS